MNTLNFNQSVGFPLETNILDEMQTSYELFNAFGALAGNFSIILGCINTAGTVSDGVVYINGETLKFKGGAVQSNVIIVETKQALEFEDGNAHDVIYTRYVTFGTATTQWLWTSFTRPLETKAIAMALAFKEDKTTVAALVARITALEVKPSNIPVGLIAIWDRPAAEIPSGWSEYVDLRGRMPIGHNPDDAEFSSLRSPGGTNKHTLTKSELPTGSVGWVGETGTGNPDGSGDSIESGHDLSYPRKTKELVLGNGTAFSLMNPHRIVHFIKYTG